MPSQPHASLASVTAHVLNPFSKETSCNAFLHECGLGRPRAVLAPPPRTQRSDVSSQRGPRWRHESRLPRGEFCVGPHPHPQATSPPRPRSQLWSAARTTAGGGLRCRSATLPHCEGRLFWPDSTHASGFPLPRLRFDPSSGVDAPRFMCPGPGYNSLGSFIRAYFYLVFTCFSVIS